MAEKKTPAVKKAASVKKKTVAKKTPVTAGDSAKAAANTEAAVKSVVEVLSKSSAKKLTAKDKTALQTALKALRARVVTEIEFLSSDGLHTGETDSSVFGLHMADAGTDAFARDTTLSIMSSEHDQLYEIDQALHRLEDGTFGECETCGCHIEMGRLEARPFARMCISCKSEMEKSQPRFQAGQRMKRTTR